MTAVRSSDGLIVTGLVKICGLSTLETLDAAVAAGADMVGLVFHPRSPRNVSLESAAALAARARLAGVRIVALTVDSDDAALAAVQAAVAPDLFQLHGTETPERAAAIRSRFEAKVIKAIGVSVRDDLAIAARFGGAADFVLIDAKPPVGATYPGGHGRMFDWAILEGFDPGVAWLISGGLTPINVADAIRIGAASATFVGVDVSSGVETAPGVKDIALIRAFIAAARQATG